MVDADCGAGILRWQVLVGEGRCVLDGLNAEVHEEPSNKSTVILVVVVGVRRRWRRREAKWPMQ